jgi:hypothetical protein
MAPSRDDNTDLKAATRRRAGFLVCKNAQIRKESARRNKSVACPSLKNTRNFVVAVSLMLVVWLGLTFVTEVPSHRYPTMGKDIQKKGLSAAVEATKENLATVPTPVTR